METKEKAPILEQIIGILEKKMMKAFVMDILGLGIYIILSVALAFYFKFKPSSDLNLIVYFFILMFFTYCIRRMTVMVRKEYLLPMIRKLKVYVKEGVPQMYVESKWGKCYNYLEHKRISNIINLLSIKADDVSFFWENLRKEIDRLSEPRKADYLIKLVELEKFFTFF